MRRSRYRFALIVATCVACLLTVAGVAGLIYTLQSKVYQAWDFDPQWADANILVAFPIQSALERFRNDHGAYPETLDDLTPKYLFSIPATCSTHRVHQAGDRWWYRRDKDEQYTLWATAMHWVSSFDAIVYRPSRTYPFIWREHAWCIDHNGWLYVAGFSREATNSWPK